MNLMTMSMKKSISILLLLISTVISSVALTAEENQIQSDISTQIVLSIDQYQSDILTEKAGNVVEDITICDYQDKHVSQMSSEGIYEEKTGADSKYFDSYIHNRWSIILLNFKSSPPLIDNLIAKRYLKTFPRIIS